MMSENSMRRSFRNTARGEAGVTLIELLIYMVVAGIVIASIYNLMISQSINYTDQREITDARETVRGAAVLLTSELRQLAASDNDVYFVARDSVAVRSSHASGIMCDRKLATFRYGMYSVAGDMSYVAGDSALVFAAAGSGTTDDSWRAVAIVGSVDTPGSWGLTNCAWTVVQTADMAIELSHDTTLVAIGAPVRAFRRVQYGIYQDAGRWWLGMKVGGAAGYTRLTGPLLPPGPTGGLVLTYYDAANNVTAVPADVSMIEVMIRSRSFGRSRHGGTLTNRQDSVRTKVYLRG
jgi:Tfp pilus assembly protein FimT